MLSDIDLREITEMTGPDRAFLTLYLSSRQSLRSLEHRIRDAEKLVADNASEGEYLSENIKLIRKYLDEHEKFKDGLCLFACWALDYFRAEEVKVPLPDMLAVDSSFYIRPLAELQDEYENYVVVIADNKKARIDFVTSARAETEDQIRGNIKNHVRKGGWSQQRYERRRDKQLHHYAKEISEQLKRLNDKEKFERIIMVGSSETLLEIQKTLPANIASKVVGTKALNIGGDENILEKEILDLYEEAERQSEQSLWRRIQNEYLRHGLAVVGAEKVAKAAKQGRVEVAVVNRNAKLAGRRCRRCENLFAGLSQSCPNCSSTSVFEVDLVNEISELLVLSGATIEFVDPIPELKEVGEVAALLRYKA